MKGILIVNTGTPNSKNRNDVKSFIGAMLSDPQVLPLPFLPRIILSKGIIAPLRASRSARKYELIWDQEHNISPLIYNTQQLASKVEQKTNIPIEIAMRYQTPSITDALQRLAKRGVDELIVMPMFPQYAESSYQTAVDAVQRNVEKVAGFKLSFIAPYYNHPAYIGALAESLKPFVKNEYDCLLFSFHSLPLSYIEKTKAKGEAFDYEYQINETIRLVSEQLKLDTTKNKLVYSSAIGKKWLEPFLDDEMQRLPKEGVKKIIAITPGFLADNLETLYDIQIRAKELFLANGGSDFRFVPALNSEDYWVDALVEICNI